jgi:hypothetical protein
MFQLFSRIRAIEPVFKARSADRDAETDRLRAKAILAAIEAALNSAEQEQAGLSRRVDDVQARAAVTFGNGTDEYLEREPLDNYHHDLFDHEITHGQRRLRELADAITHYRSLQQAALRLAQDGSNPCDPAL